MSEQEFNQKVLVLSNKLYGYSLKILGNKEDAHDVIQDLFYKFWTIRHNLLKINNIEAFAITATRNLCIDKLKRVKKNVFDNSDISKIQIVDESNSSCENEEFESRMELVKLAIGKLPEIQQKVFIMRDFEEKEFDEIALELKITIDNTRVILSRARQKIRDIIKNPNE